MNTERPTLDNWLQPPYIFWSLRHARELLPTARIRAGARTRELSSEHDVSLLDTRFDCSLGTVSVSEWIDRTEVDTFTVLRGDALKLEWLAPGVRDDDLHLMFSVTKSVTALLCGALVGRGLIDVAAPVTEYVPEVAGGGFAGATVRHLLDMTAAYDFVEDYDPGDDVRAYRWAAGWYPAPPGSPALHEFIASRQPKGEHGERFRYLSPTTDLLGWVCERATGQPYATALSENLWAPMGAETDASVTVDREGTPRAAGGLSAVPRDMARLGLLVAEGGQGIVPADFIDDLTREGSTQQWADGDFAPWLPGGAYRSCWYQPRVDSDAIMGVGIYGQMLYVDRERGVVVVKQSSWSVADDEALQDDSYLACRAIARAVN